MVVHAGYPEGWGDFRLWSADSFVPKSDSLGELKETVRSLLCGEEHGDVPERN